MIQKSKRFINDGIPNGVVCRPRLFLRAGIYVRVDRRSIALLGSTRSLCRGADLANTNGVSLMLEWGDWLLSLLLLIDGYNVVAPIAPANSLVDTTWLQRQRMQLIRRLINHLPEQVRRRTCVVFDAANPPRDRNHRFEMEGIEVRFAVGYSEADDLLEELIASHSASKRLAVVSSDHRVQLAARRRGAAPFDSQAWLDDLLDGRLRLAAGPMRAVERGEGQGGRDEESSKPSEKLENAQVDQWLREFGF